VGVDVLYVPRRPGIEAISGVLAVVVSKLINLLIGSWVEH
jgi:hypothetical protein